MKAQAKLDIQTRAFETGATAALYEHAAEQDLRDLLGLYSGKVGDSSAVEAWNAIAAAWQLGYGSIDTREPSAVDGKPSKTAQRAWQRLIKAIGYVKPCSDEAAKKKAERAAAKADKPTEPAKAAEGFDPFATLSAALKPTEPAVQGEPVKPTEPAVQGEPVKPTEPQSDKDVGLSARVTACLELLKLMDDDKLKKAQAQLLKLVEA